MHKKLLFTAVFFSGMTTLSLEMAASRLLGNYFGASNLVWASIIGLILIYLTAGYFLGGFWADRYPSFRAFFQILLWGSFTISIIPLIGRPVLRFAAEAFDKLQMGVLFGSFVTVLILFIVPVILLGTASPFAIRLAITDTRRAGTISGQIYAASTLGSFIGAFLPVLVLIPMIGTFRTFITISGIMVLVAIFGLWRTAGARIAMVYLWMPIIIALLFTLGMRGTDKSPEGLIEEGESAYNYWQVIQQGNYIFLRMNEGQGMHSVYHPTELNYFGPWEQVLAGPYFNTAPYDPNQVKSLAIIGLAAGTTARQATMVYKDIKIDGIEIDPEIIEVGRKYFDMDRPNLNVMVQDGRWGLEHSSKQYNIISIDAYRPPYIPWHLTTREFFQSVHNHLTQDGVMVINVGRAENDRRLINAFSTTIASVFPSIFVIDIPGTFNSIIYATVQPTTASNLKLNLDYLKSRTGTHPLLIYAMQVAFDNLKPIEYSTQVFTDDLAPIEWITNSMILEFFLSGEAEVLQ